MKSFAVHRDGTEINTSEWEKWEFLCQKDQKDLKFEENCRVSQCLVKTTYNETSHPHKDRLYLSPDTGHGKIGSSIIPKITYFLKYAAEKYIKFGKFGKLFGLQSILSFRSCEVIVLTQSASSSWPNGQICNT